MLSFLEWVKIKESFTNKDGQKVDYPTPPPPPKKRMVPPPPPSKVRVRSSEYSNKDLEAERKAFGGRNPFGN